MYVTDKQLAQRYGVHRTTIWRWVKESGFPTPIKLSHGCTRWSGEKVEEWDRRKMDQKVESLT